VPSWETAFSCGTYVPGYRSSPGLEATVLICGESGTGKELAGTRDTSKQTKRGASCSPSTVPPSRTAYGEFILRDEKGHLPMPTSEAGAFEEADGGDGGSSTKSRVLSTGAQAKL